MVAAAENIRVVARFRPTSAREAAAQSAEVVRFGDDGRCVTVGAEDGGGNSFAFDGILKPSATQADTYGHVSAIVDAVLQGYNGTILAYGQTGSGKTHSVMGSPADPGLLPRAVQHAFRQLSDDSNGGEFMVSCSYLEIYKEVVRDLLQPSGAKPAGLAIRESASKGVGKGVYVEGLSQVYVTCEADVLEVLECGNANRMIGSTLMNAQSSRSHALLTLTLRQQGPDGAVRVSKLNVADLAGSEKVGKTGATGETLDEACKINTSLSALCLVISALADGRPHVPYRNSKLTRILQESLGGNSKTLLLVACSPAADNAPETKSTLHFASRAKTITNAAVVNTLLSPDQLQEQADRLRAQLRAARAEVERLRGGGGGAGVPVDNTEAKAWREALAGPAEADGLRSELAQARGAAEALGEELAESSRTVAELEEALRRRDAEAEELHDMLERVQVLHGVAPKRRSVADKRSSRDGIDALRRIVVEVESARLRAEIDGEDDAEIAISGLRAQLSEQHDRIVELQALAERGRRAEAAEAEVAQLKQQLQALAADKLQRVSSKQRRMSVLPPPSFGCVGTGGGSMRAFCAGESFRSARGSARLAATTVGEDPADCAATMVGEDPAAKAETALAAPGPAPPAHGAAGSGGGDGAGDAARPDTAGGLALASDLSPPAELPTASLGGAPLADAAPEEASWVGGAVGPSGHAVAGPGLETSWPPKAAAPSEPASAEVFPPLGLEGHNPMSSSAEPAAALRPSPVCMEGRTPPCSSGRCSDASDPTPPSSTPPPLSPASAKAGGREASMAPSDSANPAQGQGGGRPAAGETAGLPHVGATPTHASGPPRAGEDTGGEHRRWGGREDTGGEHPSWSPRGSAPPAMPGSRGASSRASSAASPTASRARGACLAGSPRPGTACGAAAAPVSASSHGGDGEHGAATPVPKAVARLDLAHVQGMAADSREGDGGASSPAANSPAGQGARPHRAEPACGVEPYEAEGSPRAAEIASHQPEIAPPEADDDTAWPILVHLPPADADAPAPPSGSGRFGFVDTSRGRSRSKRASHRRTGTGPTRSGQPGDQPPPPLPALDEEPGTPSIISSALDCPPLPPPLPPARECVEIPPPGAGPPPPPPDRSSSGSGKSSGGRRPAKAGKGRVCGPAAPGLDENRNPQPKARQRPGGAGARVAPLGRLS